MNIYQRSYWAANLLSLTQDMDFADPGAPASVLLMGKRLDDGVFAVRLVPRLLTIGKAFILVSSNNIYVLANGVTSRTFDSFLEGWGDIDKTLIAGQFNFNTWFDATTVVDRHIAGYLAPSRALNFYGHSGGGGFVEAAAKYLYRAGNFNIREIITYGAPKIGTASACFGYAASVARVRWMNNGDCVTGLPFQTILGGAWQYLTFGYSRSQPWQFCHGTGGREILPDGSFRDSQDPHEHLPSSISEVGWWLTGHNIYGVGTPHRIGTYASRLLGIAADNPTPPAPLPVAPAEIPTPPRVVPPLDLVVRPDAAPVQMASVVGTNVSLNGSPPIRGLSLGVPAMPMSQINPGLRAQVFRVGAIFQVVWMDNIIASVPTKSKGNVIARAINRLCRTLGNSSSVTTVEFQASLSNYLSFAGQVGGGVKPPLNVV